MTLNDLLAIPRLFLPYKPALSYRNGADAVTLTYEQLFDAVDRLAAGLITRGLAPGDRVALFLGNRPEYVVAYLAVMRAGAIATPMNLRYRRREINHILATVRRDCW